MGAARLDAGGDAADRRKVGSADSPIHDQTVAARWVDLSFVLSEHRDA